MTVAGQGYVTNSSSLSLYKAMTNDRVINAVKEIEGIAAQYLDGKPGIVSETKMTQDNCIFVRVVCTFKFPL